MSPRILIVDDEPAFAEVLAELLVDEGYSVIRAQDGITALSMLSTQRLSPHLIVCDVMLPGLKGDRLAHEIRRRFPRRRLPILLMSASRDPQVSLRDVCFLPKPVDLRELLGTVEHMVSLKDEARSAPARVSRGD
jgi:CheY-like chemotaxis protein